MNGAIVEGEDALRRLLLEARTLAIVGLSGDPRRPSNDVSAYLQSQGYRILPVNPSETEILGERCYATLPDVPVDISIDMVVLFRRSELVGPHVDEAIARGGVRSIWMQDGVVDRAAAERAIAAGIDVVMDDCTLRRHRQLIGRPVG